MPGDTGGTPVFPSNPFCGVASPRIFSRYRITVSAKAAWLHVRGETESGIP